MMKWIIAIMALMFLMTACSSSTSEEVVKVVEVVDAVDNMTEFTTIEMRLEEGSCDPNTLEVKEGEKIRLQFMNIDPITFSFPEFGIEERVNGNHYIDLVADKDGSFDLYCVK